MTTIVIAIFTDSGEICDMRSAIFAASWELLALVVVLCRIFINSYCSVVKDSFDPLKR
ncbi:hypothetical protein D3C87_1820500 [compost metagenome]